MNVVQLGDTVQLHYTTYADDGCVIETSAHREPLEFVVGSPEVISCINRAVIGMRQNERRRIAVSPEQAFGFRDVGLQQLAPDWDCSKRSKKETSWPWRSAASRLDLWVRTISEQEISLDANHPLAGESLIYEIEVVKIHCCRPGRCMTTNGNT